MKIKNICLLLLLIIILSMSSVTATEQPNTTGHSAMYYVYYISSLYSDEETGITAAQDTIVNDAWDSLNRDEQVLYLTATIAGVTIAGTAACMIHYPLFHSVDVDVPQKKIMKWAKPLPDQIQKKIDGLNSQKWEKIDKLDDSQDNFKIAEGYEGFGRLENVKPVKPNNVINNPNNPNTDVNSLNYDLNSHNTESNTISNTKQFNDPLMFGSVDNEVSEGLIKNAQKAFHKRQENGWNVINELNGLNPDLSTQWDY